MKNDDLIFSMVENVINSTAVKVLNKMTGSEFHSLSGIKRSSNDKNYITTIGLYGTKITETSHEIKIRGNIVLSWNLDVYIKISNAIFKDEYKEYCEDIKDMGMEILNTIVGNSRSELRAKGIFIEMAIPNGFIGNQISTELPDYIMLRETTFESSLGNTQLLVTCGVISED